MKMTPAAGHEESGHVQSGRVEPGRAESGHPEYCGAFPGLSAAGARVACPAGECPTAGICRALKRLDREAGLARANRDAAARYVDGMLETAAG